MSDADVAGVRQLAAAVRALAAVLGTSDQDTLAYLLATAGLDRLPRTEAADLVRRVHAALRQLQP